MFVGLFVINVETSEPIGPKLHNHMPPAIFVIFVKIQTVARKLKLIIEKVAQSALKPIQN